MKTSELLPKLAPFARILNKNSLSPVYRTLQLEPDSIRASAGWALIETSVDLGLKTSLLVDTNTFLSVMSSLPNEEIVFEATDTLLVWSCGTAKGKLAVIKGDIDVPKIARRAKPNAFATSAAFALALDLGSISCGASSLATVGLFGVVLDNRNALTVRSTDDVTVSSCSLDYALENCPDTITLSPDGVKLLSSLCKIGGTLEFTDQTIFFRGKDIKAAINQVPALKTDLSQVVNTFSGAETTATIPRDRVESFVKRATALAEDGKKTYVILGASAGQLTLSFAEGAAATEEYYLVEGLNIPDMQQITIDASRMARVLEYSGMIVLDHLERGVLAFRGTTKDTDFRYIISGKR